MEFLKHCILNNPWYYYIKMCIPFQQFGCTISKGVVSLFLTLYKKKNIVIHVAIPPAFHIILIIIKTW